MQRDLTVYRAAERAMWAHEGVTPVEQHLELVRTRTRVRVQVVGEGEPVVFVHGASTGGTSWSQLVSRLDGFRCILVDRPGCGLSDPVATRFDDVATFARFAESLIVDVLDALSLDRAHVVATSMGGYYALRTAAAHPDRLRRVVEMGWSVGAPIEHTPLVMRITAVRALGRLMTRLPVSDRMARSMLAQVGLRQALAAGRVPHEAVDWFRAQINHTDTMRNEIEAGPPVMDLRRGINRSILLPDEVLARIGVPLLFLWGEEDMMGGAAVARDFVARIPGAQLELVPRAGHAVWMDDADAIAARTAAFLREV